MIMITELVDAFLMGTCGSRVRVLDDDVPRDEKRASDEAWSPGLDGIMGFGWIIDEEGWSSCMVQAGHHP
jgi:hypothetical protein